MKLKSGMIAGALKKAVDRTYESFLSGAFYRFLTGKGELQKKTDSCAISCLPEEIADALDPVLNARTAPNSEEMPERDENGVMLGSCSARELPTTLRQRISGVFRSSSVVSFFDALVKRAGNMRFRSLGIFLLMLGITSTVLKSILFAAGLAGGTLTDLLMHCLYCVALIAAALVMIGGAGKRLFGALRESVIGSTLWYSALGFRRTNPKADPSADKDESNGMNVLPVLAGMALGVLSVWFPISRILFAILILILASITLYMPEAGLVILLAAFPYVALIGNGYAALGVSCLWINFSWFIKYLNGKRSFHFKLTDLFFFLFALFWMLGGVISAGKGGAMLGVSGMCIALLYFPTVNLLSSVEFVQKCVRAILFGSLSVSAVGIVRFFNRSVLSGKGFDGFAETSVFTSPDLLALYLGVALILGAFLIKDRKRAFPGFGFSAVMIANTVCLILTGSYLVIGALLPAVIVYRITASRKTIGRLLLLVPILVIVYVVLPEDVRELISGLWSHTDNGVRYKFAVWQDVLPTLRAYAFTGVGITKDACTMALTQNISSFADPAQIYSHYLQMILEIGIPGLLIFLTVLLIALKNSVGTYVRTEKGSPLHSLAASASTSAVFLAFYGLGDYYWTHSTGFCLFFLVLAMNVAVSRIHGSVSDATGEPSPEDIDLSADVSRLQENTKYKKRSKKDNDQKPKGPEVTISDSE